MIKPKFLTEESRLSSHAADQDSLLAHYISLTPNDNIKMISLLNCLHLANYPHHIFMLYYPHPFR